MTPPADSTKDDGAMTNEEIDERRAVMFCRSVYAQNRNPGDSSRFALQLRASDEAAHLGYYDTRTQMAVPREPTEKMIRAGWVNAAHPADIYIAMLAACKEEKS